MSDIVSSEILKLLKKELKDEELFRLSSSIYLEYIKNGKRGVEDIILRLIKEALE